MAITVTHAAGAAFSKAGTDDYGSNHIKSLAIKNN